MKKLILAIALFTSIGASAQTEKVTYKPLMQQFVPTDLSTYRPVLKSTLDRSYKIDPTVGYTIQETKPGSKIYVLTDGVWQSAAIVTTTGVVLLDAPESYGMNIEKMVKQVTDKPITTLIYTHSHNDHISGSRYLKNIKNLEIIAAKPVASYLKEKNDQKRLVPTNSFSGKLTLKKGDKTIELQELALFHSNESDVAVYLPKEKFLMVVDLLTPGYVPFKNLDLSNNMHGYLKAFDKVLAYDFDVFLAGHLTALGNKEDVVVAKAYATDLYSIVKKLYQNTDMMKVMGEAAGTIGWENKFLLFNVYLDKIIKEGTDEVVAKWGDKLGGVDVWAPSHVSTMLNYVKWDD
ncbi:MBL fold metallo-hydrolase [Sphingobacterium detergens]|uniref:Glyoxylase-like metal-dependent hydrolase (Beta-lactamase superfamily II) n=1 Tax=Sphingobacterium detergens TaxID=1145106 RepID=A0A420BK35_SPHD1|nr:MBL fold metallo-hydrolase [Sphingobacterium detergens]RKE57088.1 glyoxylase-like metal-dependent hydrolase (beta-lactamase superfamily II) [Sphingobacterium detergens]